MESLRNLPLVLLVLKFDYFDVDTNFTASNDKHIARRTAPQNPIQKYLCTMDVRAFAGYLAHGSVTLDYIFLFFTHEQQRNTGWRVARTDKDEAASLQVLVPLGQSERMEYVGDVLFRRAFYRCID